MMPFALGAIAILFFLLLTGVISARLQLRRILQSPRYSTPAILVLTGLVAVAGCTSTNVLRNAELAPQAPGPARVLLMPLDVELSELTAGGMLEPRADWTEQAKTHVRAALDALLR